MATSLTHLEQVEDLTTCPVCFTRYDDGDHQPKFLRCSHTICITCLTRILQNGLLLCPICRLHSEVPAAGVRGIPNNPYALLLTESLRFSPARTGPEETTKTEALGSGPVDWCFTCGKSAAAICSLSSFHTTSRLAAENVRMAQKLQDLANEIKQSCATAATGRRRMKDQLQVALSFLRRLQLHLETDIEENDSQLAELVSLHHYIECDNSVSAANLQKKLTEYQDLLTQSTNKVRFSGLKGNAMDRHFAAEVDQPLLYGPVFSYICFLEDDEIEIELKPRIVKTGTLTVAVDVPSPVAPAGVPAAASYERPALGASNLTSPSPLHRRFRLEVTRSGAHFGTAELVLLQDLPILTSCLNTVNNCIINSSHPDVFVAIGEFADTASSLPNLQTPFALEAGTVGMYSMTHSKSTLKWSFIVITGPMKVTPKKTRTFARVTEGLDVFNRLSAIVDKKAKKEPFQIRWIRL